MGRTANIAKENEKLRREVASMRAVIETVQMYMGIGVNDTIENTLNRLDAIRGAAFRSLAYIACPNYPCPCDRSRLALDMASLFNPGVDKWMIPLLVENSRTNSRVCADSEEED